MALFDDDVPRKASGITPGEDLSRFSLDELEERVLALKQEIVRTEEAMAAKRLSAAAADSFFKRS